MFSAFLLFVNPFGYLKSYFSPVKTEIQPHAVELFIFGEIWIRNLFDRIMSQTTFLVLTIATAFFVVTCFVFAHFKFEVRHSDEMPTPYSFI